MKLKSIKTQSLKLITLSCTLTAAFAPTVSAMESKAIVEVSSDKTYTCKRATETDIDELLTLIDRQAASPEDRTKLVVLPKKFRALALAGALNKRRLFVVSSSTGKIVGINKVFMLDDESEMLDVITNELRLCGPQSRGVENNERAFTTSLQTVAEFERSLNFADIGKFNLCDGSYVENRLGFTDEGKFEFIAGGTTRLQAPVLVLYYGSSYVLPECRGKSAFKALNAFSYDALRGQVCTAIDANNPEFLILVFGVTSHNISCGMIDDEVCLREIDRREIIRRDFVAFAHSVEETMLSETRKRVRTVLALCRRFGITDKNLQAKILCSEKELEKNLIYALSAHLYLGDGQIPEQYQDAFNKSICANFYNTNHNKGRLRTCESYIRSYRAFMPTFDADSEELKPLPDNQSIPGYGVMVVVPLHRFAKRKE